MDANTQIRIAVAPCHEGEVRALCFGFDLTYEQAKQQCENSTAHVMLAPPMFLHAGNIIGDYSGVPQFQVVGRVISELQLVPSPLICALRSFAQVEDFRARISNPNFSLACITLSDKGYAGEREDKSGPEIVDMLTSSLNIGLVRRCLLPDDPKALKSLVMELALGQGFDLIVTTGGTGLTSHDLSPEALLPILDRRLPGMEQAMTLASLEKTPRAMISRLLAGTIGTSLVLALPGNVHAVRENLSAVLAALPHALDKLRDLDPNCGG